MMVMALFMGMFMMNPAGLNPRWMVHQHRLAAVSGFAVFPALTTAVVLSDLPHDPGAPRTPVLQHLGFALPGDPTLGFETAAGMSEGRRGGKECGSTGRYRWWPRIENKKK